MTALLGAEMVKLPEMLPIKLGATMFAVEVTTPLPSGCKLILPSYQLMI